MTINSDGLSEALIEAGEAYDMRKRDIRILAWFHLAKLVACSGKVIPKKKPKKEYLYEVMHANIYTSILDRAEKEYETDEVPTEWMRRVYKDFEDYFVWKKEHYITKVINEEVKFENKKRGI